MDSWINFESSGFEDRQTNKNLPKVLNKKRNIREHSVLNVSRKDELPEDERFTLILFKWYFDDRVYIAALQLFEYDLISTDVRE